MTYYKDWDCDAAIWYMYAMLVPYYVDKQQSIRWIEDDLKNRVYEDQYGTIVRFPFCKLIPYQNHGYASRKSNEDDASAVRWKVW